MKRILILIIGLIGVAYGQYSPTSAKSRFVNGIALGTKLDGYFNAADSNAIYWRADSVVMAKYKGTARALAFAVSGGYLPISDTAAMLSNLLRKTDTAAMLSGYQTYYPRTAISAGTGITYDASTGVITNASPSSGGTVTSVAASAGTGISVSGSPITTSGTLTITNTAPDQTVVLTAGTGIGVSGTYPNFTITNSSPSSGGTVTSVTASAPLSSTGGTTPNITISQATTSTNGFLSSTDWNTFNNKQAQLNGTGFVRMSGTTPSYITGTSSQFVKADGSLDGTSYATAASLSGYLPLSGGTLTGALSGTSLSMSGGGSFGSTLRIGGALKSWDAFEPALQIKTMALGSSGQSNGRIFTNTYYDGNYRYQGTGTATMYEADGGFFWSTAASGVADGLISWVERMRLTTAGTFLINTTTTDGTNKLIVNGGVKGGAGTFTTGAFTGTITNTNTANTFNAIGGTGSPVYFSTDQSVNNSGKRWRFGHTGGVGGFTSFDILNETDGVTALTIASTGAATFSSSVTANSFVKSGGTSTQFLMANGSTTNSTDFVDVASTQTVSGQKTFSSNLINTSGTIQSSNTSNPSLLLNNTTTGIQWYTTSNNSGSYVINNGAGSGISIGASSNISAGSMILTSTMAAKGYIFNYAAKSSNYTLTDTDDYINVTNASTITLPTAVGRAGKRYVIRSTAGSGVTSTLATTSSQTIDGAAGSFSFGNGNYNILIVFSDGANWFSEQWITGS